MPPVRNAPNGVDEVGDVHDPVLEQVADAAAAVGEELGRVGQLDVLGDDEDRGGGPALPELESGAHALVAKRRRQPNVDDRDVGLLERHRMMERVGVATAATTSKPLSLSSRVRPSRSSARSSAMTTRTAAPP